MKNKKAFTLAEMMIVLLIMSIITAAFLPVITKKNKITTELWSLASNNSDIYSQLGATQSVMIGKSNNDKNTKLLINSVASMPDQIGLEEDGNYTGRIKIDSNSNLHFGNTSDNNGYNNAVSIGSATSAQDNYSVAIGSSAQTATSSSSSGAVAIGYSSYAFGNAVAIGNLAKTDTNTNGIAIGSSAISYNGSISIGPSAMFSALSNIKGDNIAIGNSALFSASGCQGNIGIGSSTLRSVSGDYNTAVGYTALYSDNTGYSNTGIGRRALYYNTTGYNNTAIGQEAMVKNVSGGQNTSIGTASLSTHTSGNDNTAVGVQALGLDISGNQNTAIGRYSLFNNQTGVSNTAIGYSACENVTGSNKTCIGANSGPSLSSTAASDSSESIYIGGHSNFPVYTSSGSSGGNADTERDAVLEIHNTTATGSIFNATSASDDNGYATTGNLTNVVINGNLFVKGFVIANSPNDQGTYGIMDPFRKSWDNIRTTNIYSTYSDKRLKNVGTLNNYGLDKIRQLKVYNYTFKKDKKKVPQVGVIAQDLQKVFPNAISKDKNGYLMIRHDDMFYAMVNSIKELDCSLQNLKSDFSSIVARVQALTTKVNHVVFKIEMLDSKLTALLKVEQIHSSQIKQLQESNKVLQAQNKALAVRVAKLEKHAYRR